jgi:hypothetical protein
MSTSASDVAAIAVAAVGIITLVVLLSFFGAYITLLIVNYLFTPAVLLTVFGVPALGFWKAFVLNLFIGTFRAVSTSTKK